MTNPSPTHSVAVIGGATAGAEVASRLSERGILVAVFEQNARPYGKIEDGLPRWHHGLRSKEYANIREKLSHPLVHLVPNTKVGRDVEFKALVEDWGFTAVVLANGAWRDRPLPVEGADAYVGKGLTYQNPFVISFNHAEDAGYTGERHPVVDGTMVVGGGLASIDVAKIITLTCTRDALAARGIEASINELEVKGIPKTLEAHGLSWDDLGLEGSTIYYRRRIEDMPLVSAPDGATPERIAKIQKSRLTMVEKATTKFCFEIVPLSAPDSLILEGDRLVGLGFRRTRVEDGRVIATDETYEARANAIISSIGSIPEPIEGIDMKGELFDFTDWEFGRFAAYPSVFSVGNVVTGKGNIVASRKHATEVSRVAIESYLGVADEGVEAPPSLAADAAKQVASAVADHVDGSRGNTAEEHAALVARITAQQEAVGYPGDVKVWLDQVGEPC